ncbi:hypothetical protein ACFRAQ_34895 [Nocardia sp. NPDC056611]|uniref:hypothetical protein n=1 Tax=Nocardia sp. NPDC056611 TaxID=3345877 RepID=UPI00366FBD4F
MSDVVVIDPSWEAGSGGNDWGTKVLGYSAGIARGQLVAVVNGQERWEYTAVVASPDRKAVDTVHTAEFQDVITFQNWVSRVIAEHLARVSGRPVWYTRKRGRIGTRVGKVFVSTDEPKDATWQGVEFKSTATFTDPRTVGAVTVVDHVVLWRRIVRRCEGVDGLVPGIAVAAGEAAAAEVSGPEFGSHGAQSDYVFAMFAVQAFLGACAAAEIPDIDLDFFVSPQCQTMFCIADEHDDDEHVDVTGSSWIELPNGDAEITHTNHNVWTD